MSPQLATVKRSSYFCRTSLRVLIGGVAALLVIVSLLVGYFGVQAEQRHAREDLGLLAEVITASTTSATDYEASSDALPPRAWTAVRFQPSLAAAAVFGSTGELVWGWQRGGDWTRSVAGEQLTPLLGPPYETIQRRLQLLAGEGMLVLSWSASEQNGVVNAHLQSLALLLIALACVLLVAVRAVQDRLRHSVQDLSESVAEAVAEGRFETVLRSDSAEGRELANTFELVLAEVLDRDQRLATITESFDREVKARTQELVEVNSELKDSRKMAVEALAAKSTLLANMSHEIRTPMNAVVGMAALLLETDLDEDQRCMADKVVRSSDGLLSILNDILDFSKVEAGRLELEEIAFNPREIVEDVCDLVAHQAEGKGLKIGSLVHPDVPTEILGDPGRLKQMILNFAGNAVKFTHEGVVIIELHYECSFNGGSELRIEVRDTGIGIAPARQKSLFDSFSQAEGSTSRHYGGTGLGLAIVQQLATLMRGSVGVQSEEGEGSTFWARVWLRDVAGGAGRGKSPQPNLRGLRALIVDECAEMSDLCRRELESVGCHAHVEASAYGAFEDLARGATFDVLLLDSQLPGKDAFFGAVGGQGVLAEVPVVMLIPGVQAPEFKEPLDPSAFAFIRRPMKRQDLLDVLERAIGLRVSEPQQEEPAEEVDLISEERRSRTRILLVEDNQINQQLVQYILGKRGYPVDVVDNGIKALEAYGEGDYDLILMDCQMPEMDGFEATRRIRSFEEADGSHVPILAMTANAMRGDRDKCMEAGMDDYITKPIQPRDMLAWMEEWLDRCEVQKQPKPSPTAGPSSSPAVEPMASAGFAAPSMPSVQALAPPLPEAEPESPLPASDSSSAAPALDPMILGCLRDGDPVGEELALELIDSYMSTAPEIMEEIERLVSGENWGECASVAHKFVSSNGTIGAMDFAQLLRRMEGACREGRHEDVPDMAAQGRLELERALDELRAME